DNDEDTLVDYADGDCPAAPSLITIPTVTFENTLGLCTDGIDNDEDTLVDYADGDCTGVVATTTVSGASSSVENTIGLCTDGIDNDEDTLVDYADGDCPAVATTTPPTTTVVGGGGVVGSSFGSGPSTGGFGGGITSGTPISGVFTQGTTTASCVPMTTYIKLGKKNSMQEVTRLQAFLNVHMGLKLTPSGFYNSATYNAVKSFQLKYKDNVLTPWGITAPTGYFYKTTQRQMNMILCPNVNFPMPVLN
ncbi:hypothetical protein H7X65_01445, partial [Candidatus Parcubacteria bacterium]|nr:hypothetical protein [Candidatus Parcubacteria bacterium]